MIPAKQQKIDISKMNEEEKKLFRLYGKVPSRKDLLTHKPKERKYFDSGDYALSKAGKNNQPVGEQHPSPDNIPHQNPALMPVPSPAEKLACSPVKET
ncbi:camp-regulated phospho protein/endosulfine conserved region-domain-containing protein, partial [Dimargaris cristalligena]